MITSTICRQENFKEDIEYNNPYIENQKDMKTVSFSSNGDVLNGNIYKNSILDIMNSYTV